MDVTTVSAADIPVGLPEGVDALHCAGDPGTLASCPRVGVIGARRATPYGLAVAGAVGRALAEAGATVVSGGAMGCDAAALRAAQGAGGRTVVVSGTGPDVAYPRSSSDVFAAADLVVSREPAGAPPTRRAFPRRNDLLAHLCDALVVVEAGLRSGMTSAAERALGLGRDVWAVPGSILSPESGGTNALLANGARPLVSVDNVFDIAGAARPVGDATDAPADRLVGVLVASPLRADELAAALGTEPAEALRELAVREASGAVTRLPDGRWSAARAYLCASIR